MGVGGRREARSQREVEVPAGSRRRRRPGAPSSSLTLPSPSVSIDWRSWNAGISAMSMTTSRSTASRPTVRPA
jgi:hypothetical protein